MKAQPALLKALLSKQGDSLSDQQMARRLGISRELWNKTRRGKLDISEAVLRGTMREFPELAAEVLSFLRENGTVMPDNGIDASKEEVA